MSDEDRSYQKNNFAWFERKMKAKMTTFAIILITIAFYATLGVGADLSFFVDYAVFISLLVGALNAADVINTLSFNKTGKKESDDRPT